DRTRCDRRRGRGPDRPGRGGPDDGAGLEGSVTSGRRRASDHRGRVQRSERREPGRVAGQPDGTPADERVTATMTAMRAAIAALAVGLVLVAEGCGSGTASTSTSSSTDAASLVPASALAYVSAAANLDSASWQVVKG